MWRTLYLQYTKYANIRLEKVLLFSYFNYTIFVIRLQNITPKLSKYNFYILNDSSFVTKEEYKKYKKERMQDLKCQQFIYHVLNKDDRNHYCCQYKHYKNYKELIGGKYKIKKCIKINNFPFTNLKAKIFFI